MLSGSNFLSGRSPRSLIGDTLLQLRSVLILLFPSQIMITLANLVPDLVAHAFSVERKAHVLSMSMHIAMYRCPPTPLLPSCAHGPNHKMRSMIHKSFCRSKRIRPARLLSLYCLSILTLRPLIRHATEFAPRSTLPSLASPSYARQESIACSLWLCFGSGCLRLVLSKSREKAALLLLHARFIMQSHIFKLVLHTFTLKRLSRVLE